MDPKSSSTKRRAKGNISLEQYLYFIAAHNHGQLSNNHLNQIVLMNGFKKLSKPKKMDLVDAVNSLDLMDPSRSTLKENVSPHASIGLEEAIKDLALLNWQECCVTSIQTLISCRVNSSSSPQESLSVRSAKRSEGKPKSKAPERISLHGSAHASSCASADMGESIENLNGKPKRKRLGIELLKS